MEDDVSLDVISLVEFRRQLLPCADLVLDDICVPHYAVSVYEGNMNLQSNAHVC